MTTERELEGMLDRWLAIGPVEAPDHLADGVAGRIERQGQRPAWRIGWRRSISEVDPRALAAVAAVVAVAVLGVAMLAGPSRLGVAGPSPAPGTTSGSSSSPTASPGPSPSPSPDPTASPIVFRELSAGTHTTDTFAEPFSFMVPPGWWYATDYPGSFGISRGSAIDAPGLSISRGVYPPELDAQGCPFNATLGTADWDRPHAVADLLAYLQAHPGLSVASAKPVLIGGLSGLDIDVRPNRSWISHCPDDPLRALPGALAPLYVIGGPGEAPSMAGMGAASPASRLTVLDGYRGQTLMVRLSGDDPSFLEEAAAIIGNLEFVRPAPSLGELEPGAQSSEAFRLPFTYEVPAGWWKDADADEAFVLIRGGPGASDYIEFIGDVYPPEMDDRHCQVGGGRSTATWERPHAGADLVAYLASHPGLVVDSQTRVTVGGLSGWKLVVAADESWTSPCAGNPGSVGPDDLLPLWVHRGLRDVPGTVSISPGHPGRQTTFFVLDGADGQTMVLDIEGDDPGFIAEANAIVESIRFEPAS